MSVCVYNLPSAPDHNIHACSQSVIQSLINLESFYMLHNAWPFTNEYVISSTETVELIFRRTIHKQLHYLPEAKECSNRLHSTTQICFFKMIRHCNSFSRKEFLIRFPSQIVTFNTIQTTLNNLAFPFSFQCSHYIPILSSPKLRQFLQAPSSPFIERNFPTLTYLMPAPQLK